MRVRCRSQRFWGVRGGGGGEEEGGGGNRAFPCAAVSLRLRLSSPQEERVRAFFSAEVKLKY